MATGLEKLKGYQMAQELEIRGHEITKEFPKDERYRSVDQLRRSASSVTNNIAEAYYKQSMKERIHILKDIAICEAEETRSNLQMCSVKRFAEQKVLIQIVNDYTSFMKATHGYIRFLKDKLAN